MTWTEPEDLAEVKAGLDSLPEGFWDLPQSFIDDPKIQKLYQSLYQQLLDENPDRDTIETMMIERAAALYSYMRYVESADGFNNPNNYRQLVSLWNSMANDLRKTRTVNFDEAKVREEISLEFVSMINAALQGFDPPTANTIRRRLANALDTGKA